MNTSFTFEDVDIVWQKNSPNIFIVLYLPFLVIALPLYLVAFFIGKILSRRLENRIDQRLNTLHQMLPSYETHCELGALGKKLILTPQNIIFIEASFDGGPFFFFDCGGGEYFYINDISDSHITNDNLSVLRNFLYLGKNSLGSIQVEIAFGINPFSENNDIHSIHREEQKVGQTFAYYIDDDGGGAEWGDGSLVFYTNAEPIPYHLLPKSTDQNRETGEEFWKGLYKYVVTGEKKEIRVDSP